MKLRLFLLASLLPLAALRAADKPVNRDQMLKDLDTLEVKHRDTQSGSINSVISEISGAAGNATAAAGIYQKAVFQVQFDGAKGDHEDFRRWQKREDPLFHDANFTEALSLRFRYLALTLQAATGTERAKLADPLVAYVREVWQFPADYADTDTAFRPPPGVDRPSDLIHDVLVQGLSEGPVEKFYQVDKLAGAQKQWEMVPSNTDGILDQAVFPLLRQQKSPLLPTLWDERIAAASDFLKGKNVLTDQRDRFENEILPTLQWRRAQDVFLVVDADEGLRQMLDLIRTYPLHIDNPKWISQLRGTLKNGKLPDDDDAAKDDAGKK